MSLSCSCGYDFDPEQGCWWYMPEREMDFEKFKKMRAKRCCSCGKLIKYGDDCLKFGRFRYPKDEYEAKLNGDRYFEMNYEPNIPMASHYHCSDCGEIYLNLTAVGYECISPGESMSELLSDYHELTGFTPATQQLSGKSGQLTF